MGSNRTIATNLVARCTGTVKLIDLGAVLLAGGFSLAIGLALELWAVFQLPV